jgi:hypothetical protein
MGASDLYIDGCKSLVGISTLGNPWRREPPVSCIESPATSLKRIVLPQSKESRIYDLPWSESKQLRRIELAISATSRESSGKSLYSNVAELKRIGAG